LKRLRTDYLDVVHLHCCGPETLRRGDVIEALRRVRDAGKTRYIGYSGDGIAALDAIDCGAFDTLQISVNIADQEAIERVLPVAVEAGIGIIAKRSIANAVWRSTERIAYSESYRDRLGKLNYRFLQSKLQNGIECALRFTLGTEVQTALVGTTSPQHLLEDMELAASGPLPASEFDSIRTRWKIAAQPDWIGLQ
jgi:aryl-alcohol dehydrogenase-like predicted oxidoreductase